MSKPTYAVNVEHLRRYVTTCRACLTAASDAESEDMLDRMAASPLPQPLKEAIWDAMTGTRLISA
jgi:hypothetical protein